MFGRNGKGTGGGRHCCHVKEDQRREAIEATGDDGQPLNMLSRGYLNGDSEQFLSREEWTHEKRIRMPQKTTSIINGLHRFVVLPPGTECPDRRCCRCCTPPTRRGRGTGPRTTPPSGRRWLRRRPPGRRRAPPSPSIWSPPPTPRRGSHARLRRRRRRLLACPRCLFFGGCAARPIYTSSTGGRAVRIHLVQINKHKGGGGGGAYRS